MDPVCALRRCVKRPGPLEFQWWPPAREAAAELYGDLVTRYNFRRETAHRSLQLFERLAALHGEKGQESEILLDMAVAFVISHKFEEVLYEDIRTFATAISVSPGVLRDAEKLALAKLDWRVYSPTALQFLDAMVGVGPDRERAAKLIDRFALHKDVSPLSSEELARAALDVAQGVNGAHTELLKSIMEPRTALGKRHRATH